MISIKVTIIIIIIIAFIFIIITIFCPEIGAYSLSSGLNYYYYFAIVEFLDGEASASVV